MAEIFIIGDITRDFHYIRRDTSACNDRRWNSDANIDSFPQYGGTHFIGTLLEKGLKVEVDHYNPPNIDDIKMVSSFSLLKKSEKNNDIYILEKFLGIENFHKFDNKYYTSLQDDANKINSSQRKLLIINDADSYFKTLVDFYKNIDFDVHKIIIYKTIQPFRDNALIDQLLDKVSSKMILVIPIDEVRKYAAQISQGLSWESTAEDLDKEISRNKDLKVLKKPRYVIVSLYENGAYIRKNISDDDYLSTLIYTPEGYERSLENEEGAIPGSSSLLVAGIAYSLRTSGYAFSDNGKIDNALKIGVKKGVNASRYKKETGIIATKIDHTRTEYHYPIKNICSYLKKSPKGIFNRDIPKNPLSPWCILQPPKDSQQKIKFEEYYQNSADIVKNGLTADSLKEIPIGKFNKINTVDRKEIEGYRSIQLLIQEYLSRSSILLDDGTEANIKPLSIAIFGASGTGKSFGIKQVVDSFKKAISVQEVNLSQVTHLENLLIEFHKIRDKNLKGKVPLVIFDEYDTNYNEINFFWCSYFLGPMQDGVYRAENILHPIGKAIFVFCASRYATYEAWKSAVEDNSSQKNNGNSKLKDFSSRLHGYVEVAEINNNLFSSKKPKNLFLGKKMISKQRLLETKNDENFMFRRALIMRSIFEKKYPSLFNKVEDAGKKKNVLNIDEDVLKAFLTVKKYTHGVRSLEAIIDMSKLHNQTKFIGSCLPSKEQLGLHTSGDEFIQIIDDNEKC